MGNTPTRVGVVNDDNDNHNKSAEKPIASLAEAESTVSWTAAAVEKIASYDLPSEAAVLFSRVAASDGSKLVKALVSLAGGASDILAALKPAASIAGPFLVVAELALCQFVKWDAARSACGKLRESVSALVPIVTRFGSSAELSRDYANLLIVATK
jgi:hypothetical protein